MPVSSRHRQWHVGSRISTSDNTNTLWLSSTGQSWHSDPDIWGSAWELCQGSG